jgi:hypothetical protein
MSDIEMGHSLPETMPSAERFAEELRGVKSMDD